MTNYVIGDKLLLNCSCMCENAVDVVTKTVPKTDMTNILEVVLVVLFVILVIILLIVGFNKLKGDDNEEIETQNTYY